ncbi:MAG: hypothetical protein ACXVA8_13200 [Bdellovibrionota bacterium]
MNAAAPPPRRAQRPPDHHAPIAPAHSGRIFRPSGQPLNFVGVTPDLATANVEGENFPRERELTL